MPDAGPDAEAILAANAQVRSDLLATLARVPESRREELALGEWRLRDVVAHLAGAQDGYAEALEHIARGEQPVIADYGPPGPPHEWNARVVAQASDRAWPQLLEALAAARSRHEVAVRACQGALADNERARFFAANVARHEGQHLDAIRQWLAAPLRAQVEAVIDANRAARAELLAAVDALTAEQRREVWFGDWSLHEVVAHVAAWQDGFAIGLEQIAAGERPAIPGFDRTLEDAEATDRFNAAAVERAHGQSWETLLGMLRSARERHERAVHTLAEHLDPARFEPGRAARRLAEASEHDREHIPAILEWRRSRGYRS